MNNPIAALFKFALGIVILIILAIIAINVFVFVLIAGAIIFALIKTHAWLISKGIMKAPERTNPFHTNPHHPSNTSLDDGPTIEVDYEVIEDEVKK